MQSSYTSDLYLASALVADGFVLKQIDRAGDRATFVFVDDPDLAPAIARFYAGQLDVDARALSDNVRALKRSLHAGVAR